MSKLKEASIVEVSNGNLGDVFVSPRRLHSYLSSLDLETVTSWDEILDKPESFPSSWGELDEKPSLFPPEAHSHTASITQLRGGGTVSTNGNYALSEAITGFDLVIIQFSPSYVSASDLVVTSFTFIPGRTPYGSSIYYSPPYWIGTLRAVEFVFTTASNLRVVGVGGHNSPRLLGVWGIKYT